MNFIDRHVKFLYKNYTVHKFIIIMLVLQTKTQQSPYCIVIIEASQILKE